MDVEIVEDGDAEGLRPARSRIVEVAADLLAAHGPDGVTMRAVSGGAGVQPPAVYRLFGDKDGLLDAVTEHVYGGYARGKSVDDGDGADPIADFRTAWRRHIEFGLAHPGVITVLADPRRAARSRAAALGRAVLLGRIRRIAAAGRLRVGEQHAADLAHATGTGTILTLLAAPAEHRDLALVETSFRAVLGAITTDAPAVAGPGSAPAAAALRAGADTITALTPAERALLVEWLDRVVRADDPA
jgi:AcrR family transcriptional regulator